MSRSVSSRCKCHSDIDECQNFFRLLGWITWHAFPFNSEMEFYDKSLTEFGLDLSIDLAKKFDKKQSVVMSQRDVPGLFLLQHEHSLSFNFLHRNDEISFANFEVQGNPRSYNWL